MGTQLVLTKISVNKKPMGLFYHHLYERDGKPSLDIALNPKDGTIVYVNFILQDESVVHFDAVPILKECKLQFVLPTANITPSNYHDFSHADFIVAFGTGDLWILRQEMDWSLFDCYKIDDNNWILYKDSTFAGIVYKNLCDCELDQLRVSGYNV